MEDQSPLVAEIGSGAPTAHRPALPVDDAREQMMWRQTRMSLRERELAVRTALGGSRWRLIRQTLAEALLLSGVGTILGIGD